jgi:hypothetical protein
MKRRVFCLILHFVGVFIGYAQVVTTFNNQETTEGWTTSFFSTSGPFTTPMGTGTAVLSHGVNGDNKIDIAYFGSSLLYFEASARYLGNVLFAYGQPLSFDVSKPGGGGSNKAPDVILVGAQMTLVLGLPQYPSTSSFLGHVDITLLPSSAWHIATLNGAIPTSQQFQNVLSSLSALRIRGLPTGGGVGGIDNIVLVPEPSIITMLAISLVGVTFFHLRRIRHFSRCSAR